VVNAAWHLPRQSLERAHGHEPGLTAGCDPLCALSRQGPPRDELMDMRMGGQLSGPRVEDAHHAELPTAVVRGQRQSVEGSSRGLPPQVVQETWG
jgi:hypothetical protein